MPVVRPAPPHLLVVAVTARPACRLDTDPLTANQLGRIHQEFLRLSFDVRRDRDERLRLTGLLAQSGPIETTNELTMGQAGRAINALIRCRNTQDLYMITDPEPATGLLSALIKWIFA